MIFSKRNSIGAGGGKQRTSAIVCSLLVGLGSFCCIAATLDDVGWTWDEVYYFMSSDLQIEWFSALVSSFRDGTADFVLSQKIVDEYWLWDIAHNPHPPFYRMLSGAARVLFGNMLGDFAAYRLSSALLASALVFCLFWTVQKKYGLLPALYGSFCLVAMPRFFGHAHIAATEIPVAAFWFFSYWAFWKGRERVSGSVLLGIFIACGLATKFTAVLIPIPFVLWSVLYRDKRAIRNILVAVFFSPALAFLLNPGWWHDPVGKIAAYLHASLAREQTIPIATYFAGELFTFSPPWYYSPVMIAITVPAVVLFAVLTGAVWLMRERFKDSYDVLFLLNIPFIFFVVMLPNAPVHDGVRQFFSLLPFLAYVGAIGLYYVTKIVTEMRIGPPAKGAVCAACLLCLIGSPVYQLVKNHPYGLSYYNELAGGLKGAYNSGMELTYWFDAIDKEFLELLHKTVPDGATLSVWPPNIEYFAFLQKHGKIKDSIEFIRPEIDLVMADTKIGMRFRPEQPDYLVLLSRIGGFNAWYRIVFSSCTPLGAVRLDDVPLASLYHWKNVIDCLGYDPVP